MSKSHWKALALAAAVSLLMAPLTQAGGGSPAPQSTEPTIQQTPAQEAQILYNQGLKARNKAWKLQAKADAADGAEREALEAKVQKQYKKAIGALESATRKNPAMHQAHSSLGYALRKTGDFENSLAAYNRALSLAPNYAEAIEYRAEAFLGLNRVEEAKESYLRLFRVDREKADDLMAAMRTWVSERNENPAGLDSEVIESFAAWCQRREQLADQNASLYGGEGRRW